MGKKSDQADAKRSLKMDRSGQGRRTYLETVGGLAAGLAIGGVAAWLAKPAERVEVPGETVTLPGATVTQTATVGPTPTAVVSIGTIAESVGFGRPAGAIIEKFNRRYAEYEVDVLGVPWEECETKIMSQFVAKSPTYAMLPMVADWRATMGREFEPLDPYLERYGEPKRGDFFEAVWDAFKVDGKQRCIPFRSPGAGGSGDIWFYRKDKFEEMGLEPPTNMEEFYETCKALSEPGEFWGSGVTAEVGHIHNTWFTTFLSQGGRLLTPEEDAVTDYPSPSSELFEDILGTWIRCMDEELFPPGTLSHTTFDLLALFQEGRVGFVMMNSMRRGVAEDPEESKVAGKVGYVPAFLPEGADPATYQTKAGNKYATFGSGGWGLGINPSAPAEEREGAFELIQFMTNYENQLDTVLNYANRSARKDVAGHPEVLKLPQARADAIITAYLRAWYNPKGSRLFKMVADECHAALTKVKTPKEATKTIWETAEEILRE